jgi:uncharacterized protein DUF3551
MTDIAGLARSAISAQFCGVRGATQISKEALMRIPALAILTFATILTAAPARAQTYDPAYPVCLHVYTRGANYYECRYTSLPQCNASASGRAAQCVINPYFAGAQVPADYRRHHRVY